MKFQVKAVCQDGCRFPDFIGEFKKAMKSRSITKVDSDAYDMSFDVCVDEAAMALGAFHWKAHGHNIYLDMVNDPATFQKIIAEDLADA